jgi:hypothetical protein
LDADEALALSACVYVIQYDEIIFYICAQDSRCILYASDRSLLLASTDPLCVLTFPNEERCDTLSGTFINGTGDPSSVTQCKLAMVGDSTLSTCQTTSEATPLCSGNRDLCTIFDICRTNATAEDGCTALDNETFPVWVEPGMLSSNEVVQGILQYYNGSGFCLAGAASGWYKGTFGKAMSACADTEVRLDARTFTEGKLNNDDACSTSTSCGDQVRLIDQESWACHGFGHFSLRGRLTL